MKPKVVIVLGPTATGKSELGLRLAEALGGEVISADSMQVYRLMDIGTAKPPADVRREIPHHLIDVVWPDEPFSAGDFLRLARGAVQKIAARGRVPLVVGGTGLYIKALTEGLVEGATSDPALRARLQEEARKVGGKGLWQRLKEVDPEGAQRVHPNDLYRIVRALELYELTGLPASTLRRCHGFKDRPYEVLKIGLLRPREELYRRIDERVERMIKEGLQEEVRGLLERGYSPELKSMKAIGYREMVQYLQGETGLEEAIRRMKRDTRHFAKRQMTWFRADPEVRWFRYPEEEGVILERVARFLEGGEDGGEGPAQVG